MTAADREAAARRQRAQEIALWRWTLVEPAMDPALSARQRGAVVRDLASREHEGPDGKRKVPVSRRTLDRWVVARREGGFEALVPEPRQCAPRTDEEIVELAAGLKMENPARTAAQVRRILIARLGPAEVPSERAIQRWFAGRELNTRPGGQPPEAFGRFEADTVNEIWTADLMNGPVIGGRDCHLSVIIDDRSRFLTGARFVRRPDAVRFAGALRAAIAAHGVPQVLYCDNGSCYADMSLQRTCAVLGMKLTHSQPGRPMGRGKVERVIETIQQQFMVEVTGDERHPRCRRWRSSTACWTRGSAPSTTPESIPRPVKPRRPATRRPGRPRCRTPPGCGTRSRGARSGWSARRRLSTSRETSTPWTRSSWAGRSSWSSTRST
jgi:putative transposase